MRKVDIDFGLIAERCELAIKIIGFFAGSVILCIAAEIAAIAGCFFELWSYDAAWIFCVMLVHHIMLIIMLMTIAIIDIVRRKALRVLQKEMDIILKNI